MLKQIESIKKESEGSIVPFGIIYRLWSDGAFDEYSDEHFMIHSINEDAHYFEKFFRNHYVQMTYASVPYASIDSFFGNFVVNLENSFRVLVGTFGYDNIRRFVTNQLSAGKEQYDEEAFFEALSEIHILSFICQYGGMQVVACEPLEFDQNGYIKRAIEPVRIISAEYEPPINGKANPEARFRYEDGTILDVEIKTPNFSDVMDKQFYLMPGFLIDGNGRKNIKGVCEKFDIHCLLPNVSKMKDFLNSSARKFQNPESDKHINLLCVNWTGAAVDKDDIKEPLIILSNVKNGIFVNPDIATKCQISQKALSSVSAVLLYKMELGALLFSDFRFIFANGKARVVLNRFSENLNTDVIHRITKLSCIYPEESGISCSLYANNICYSEKMVEMSL